jgi:hypothetical protein
VISQCFGAPVAFVMLPQMGEQNGQTCRISRTNSHRDASHTRDCSFDSLFSLERKLWTLENLRQFHALFVGRWDAGEGSFFEKLRKQLEGANDDTLQLAAELLYVQQFFTSVTGPERKIENVKTVLGWCTHPPSIPVWAVEGVQRGISRDQSFNQHRPHHLAWLNEFLIHWQELPEATRREMLADPWRFAKEVRGLEFAEGAYQPIQEAWLYMAFPDAFESISSRKDKRRNCAVWSAALPGQTAINQGTTNLVQELGQREAST